MSLKTYDRKGQVWMIAHSSGAETTFIVTGTQGRVKKKDLIIYRIVTSQDSRVWSSTIPDNLKSRWESSTMMKRIV